MKAPHAFPVLFLLLACSVLLNGQVVPVATSWDFPINYPQDDYRAAVTDCTSKVVVLGFLCYNSDRKAYHLGIDISAIAGTSVHASADGIVRFAGQYGWCKGCWEGDLAHDANGGWGYLVVVEHRTTSGETVLSIYGHLQAQLLVSEGQIVSKGDLIGQVGHYECWGDHLHFAVFKGDFGSIRSGACPLQTDPTKRQRFPSFQPAGYISKRDTTTKYLNPAAFVLNGESNSPPTSLSISSVSPNPVSGSTSPQPFTIQGSGFSSTSTVTLRSLPAGGGGQIYTNQPIVQRDSTHLQLLPTLGITESQWSAEVLDGTQFSGQYVFLVAAPSPSPTINSVTPNPVPGSNNPQLLTINGSGFTSTSTVTLRSLPPGGGGQTYPNQPISSRSSGQLTLPVNLGTTGSQWSVEVLDGSAASGPFLFSVSPPALPPIINSVSPNPVPGSNSTQQFTINGSGFTSDSTVTLRSYPAGGGGQTYLNQPISSRSNGQLILPINLGTTGSQWSVEVVNGPVSSGQFFFSVIAPPTPTPAISSVIPSPVPGSNNAQQFTINGSGFTPNSTVTFRSFPSGGGGGTYPNQQISSQTGNQLILFVNLGTTGSQWSVEVLNGSVPSGQFLFSVTSASAPAPVINSVTPNPVPRSNNSQQFIINGSGFTTASTVTFRSFPVGGGGQTYQNQPISSRSSGQLILFVSLGTTPAQWSVEVLNGGVSSGQFFFSVQ